MTGVTAFALLAAAGIVGYFLLQEGETFLSSKLSAQQISQYAAAAGFSGDDLVTAVAVALAESSGNPNAHGDTSLGTGTGSFGLWQIYSDAHPEYGPNFDQLYDPQTNANAAYAIFSASGWAAWSTFKSGAYEAYVPQAQTAVQS